MPSDLLYPYPAETPSSPGGRGGGREKRAGVMRVGPEGRCFFYRRPPARFFAATAFTLTAGFGFAATFGLGGGRTPFRYCPVKLSRVAATSSGVPTAMSRPPPAPPAGPRSITQS